ncbi:ABC transporter permease [Shewanella intestini]|uniref:ABC transporter permease n=1 Tax=Shewanella intestini TaxID=2017544 RepID=A0ABS5I4K7_9GAMM|nr:MULTISPECIES: ABC transporter permease [Shewanella]MBR9728763.1 ABC transporter permease [Shewanella intestini]MRG36838.1 ABC transporter permease [Shewanella sp. XMDDZSB0408]
MRFLTFLRHELFAILSDKAIVITMFGGVAFYAFLYPLPYLHNVPSEQPIVVVDHDHSSFSRLLIRHANASPKLDVVGLVQSDHEAQQWIEQGKAKGLVIIPQGFRRDLMLGKGVTLAIAGDANYFLVYSAIAQGMVNVGLDGAKHIQFAGMLARGEDAHKAQLSLHALTLNSVPSFNTTLGYMSYILPAVLLLVLHQTLLIGSGILGAGQWRKHGYWRRVSPLMLVSGRITMFSLIYILFSSFYFGFCHFYYQLTVAGQMLDIALVVLPFILASAAFGVAMSCLFTRRDMPTQVILLISMPILFSSGLVWPLALIPEPIMWLTQVIPAVPAMMAMTKLNQLGADWSLVLPIWLQLWGLFVTFSVVAYFGVKARLSATVTAKGGDASL